MNWKSVILRPNETMEKAICTLNDQIPKIIMVADENGRLLGTVTDGDIRRGLIIHLPMNTKIEEIQEQINQWQEKCKHYEDLIEVLLVSKKAGVN